MSLDLRFYFSLFLRRIHYFLIALALGSAVGITLAIVLPPVFRAEAMLIVESQQIPDELAATTVQTETSEQLQIIQQRILTRDSLLEMANRLNIYAPAPGEVAARIPADEIVQDMRGRIKIATTGGQTRRGPAQATIKRWSFLPKRSGVWIRRWRHAVLRSLRFRNAILRRCQIVLNSAVSSNLQPKSVWPPWSGKRPCCGIGVTGWWRFMKTPVTLAGSIPRCRRRPLRV